MKKYIKPNITTVIARIYNPLMGQSQFDPANGSGGGNQGDYIGTGQLGKQGFIPVSEDNANSIWED